jgi:predicted cobalt transporter CbtA
MVGSLLLRGMLVGVLAGLLAFAFARVFAEPQIDRAIAFEDQGVDTGGAAQAGHDHAGHQHAGQAAGNEDEEDALVSRTMQAGLGLLTGTVVYGAAVGGIFALVFAFVYGRLGPLGARGTSALLALAAFVSVVLVPQIKYPANPPAVGNAVTIGERTEVYFAMLAISIAATIAAAMLGGWNAVLLAGAAFVVVIAAVQIALPAVDEVPEGFPADLLWRFRMASIGIHAILWTVIGVGFGLAAERQFAGGHMGRLATDALR